MSHFSLRHLSAAFFSSLLLAVSHGCSPDSPSSEYHEWEDQSLLHINREAPRAAFFPYSETPGDRQLSLDGLWRFHWTRTPDEQPSDFFRTGFSDSGWDLIPVPGDWEMLGYGTPIYSSSGYTFKIDPPRVMGEPKKDYTAFVERNPTGCYRRSFRLPADWKGREVFVRFGSVSSAFYLYVNGSFVGYSQGSMEPAEFRLTPFLRPDADNLIALKVLKYSDGSYLEDQDMWRIAGLHRGVSLFATDSIRIRDFAVRTSISGSTALVSVHPELESLDGFSGHGYRLSLSLTDADGRDVASGDFLSADAEAMLNVNHKAAIMNLRTPQRGYPMWGWLQTPVDNPKLWSPENPYLYSLTLTLSDSLGNVVEKVRHNIGVRSVEIAGGQLLVNGIPTRLRGVNRHEMHPVSGHVMSDSLMIRDILLMKRANINAVRTCHYPNVERWYELCDSLGLFVLDEADIEEHGLRGGLASDPSWTAAWLDRTQRLVLRDRNYACVIGWSLGNEAGWGSNFASSAAWIRETDPTRFIHYEGAQGSRSLLDGSVSKSPDPSYVDVISRFYPRTQDEYLNPGVADNNMERPENARWERLLSIARDNSDSRPVLTSEYAHAMGNALGNMKEYWGEIYSTPRMLGGFIWEWADEGILKKTDSVSFIAYGGDFGDKPNLKAFCIKGVVSSFRETGAKYEEVKAVYSPVTVASVGGKLSLVKRDPHVSLSDYVLSEETDPETGFRQASVRLGIDKPWAKAGHEVYHCVISSGHPKKAPAPPATVAADISQEAIDWFESTVHPHLYRAPLDNDRGFGNWIAKDWTRQGLDSLVDSVAIPLRVLKSCPDEPVWLSSKHVYKTRNGSVDVVYSVLYFSSSYVHFTATFSQHGSLPTLPCLGVSFRLPLSMDSVAYTGMGPVDNYPDRLCGSRYGAFRSSVADQYVHYPRPQDCGNHMSTDYVCVFGGGKSFSVMPAAGDFFSFSALPFSAHEIASVKHDHELPAPSATYLNVDAALLGTGNGSCGPGVLKKYSIDSSTRRLDLILISEPSRP